MSTTQRTTTARTPTSADPRSPGTSLRRTASIVGWLFVVTYVPSITAKVVLYPPLLDGDYVTGPGQDTRVLWGPSWATVPEFFWELSLGIYLIVKGFKPSAGTAETAVR